MGSLEDPGALFHRLSPFARAFVVFDVDYFLFRVCLPSPATLVAQPALADELSRFVWQLFDSEHAAAVVSGSASELSADVWDWTALEAAQGAMPFHMFKLFLLARAGVAQWAARARARARPQVRAQVRMKREGGTFPIAFTAVYNPRAGRLHTEDLLPGGAHQTQVCFSTNRGKANLN